ncbi:sensor histidine kinase [Parabacteroides goldsteinii]
MKARLLFLFLCLTWNGWADTFVPYNPDSLKKGDWITLETVHYYPNIAPGIKEEIPWRAENIRRITIQATVAEKTDKSISIDYTLDNLYDCHNAKEKPGFYYFDSRYQQDFAFENNTSDKQILRVTYDRKSREPLVFDKENSSYSYSKTYVPFGVRSERLSDYMAITIRDSVNLEQLLTPITNDILTKWKTDGTILFAPDTRVVDASFALPPNTEFTCSNYGLDTSKDSTIHKKIFIAYPTEYKVGERIKLLLTPGDSIIQDKEAFANTHTYRYEGRGSEQNNLQYNTQRFSYYNSEYGNISPNELKKSFQHRDSLFQTTLEKDFKKMDPYWKRVFELSEQYFKGGFILRCYMFKTDKEVWYDSSLLDWQAPPFASVNPLIDNAYHLKNPYSAHYGFFLYMYATYKKQELKSDNLCLNKQNITPQEDYLLNKQIFSGYPKYFLNGANLTSLMYSKTLHEIEDDYTNFITSCPDTSLTNEVKRAYNTLLPFEAGKNIKESGLVITDSLHLVKGSDRKYILLFLSGSHGLSGYYLQEALDLKKLLQEKGLASTVQFELYANFKAHNAEVIKPFKAIPEKQSQDLNFKLGFGTITILMREDGTILYRRLGGFTTRKIPELIQKDLNREDKSFNDFMKGFKEGILGALLIAAIIGIIYYFRNKNKQKQERNRRHIRELELRAIRSQMNPHFIFNALSSIQNLINRSANQEANKYLIDFSRLLRKVLATSEKKLVPLSDEIEQLELYLKLEQLRYPFSYSLTVDQNIEPDAIEIPGMLIQPFVENAVKHGIAPRGTGEIIIRLSLQDQLLIIDITDDGPGLKTEANGGFGIRAVTNEFEILKTLYNTEIGITIENRQEKESVSGCHVQLSIPL